jgi:hypothetical protein
MRIGLQGNYLSLEPLPQEGGWTACRIEAVVTTARLRFAAVHEKLIVDSSEEVIQSLRDFEARRTFSVQIALPESGWIRLNREAEEDVVVSYSIKSHRPVVTMEGAIPVEGERGRAVCRELRELLSGV